MTASFHAARRSIAVVLSAALLVASPGPLAVSAAAQVMRVPSSAAMTAGMNAAAAGIAPGAGTSAAPPAAAVLSMSAPSAFAGAPAFSGAPTPSAAPASAPAPAVAAPASPAASPAASFAAPAAAPNAPENEPADARAPGLSPAARHGAAAARADSDLPPRPESARVVEYAREIAHGLNDAPSCSPGACPFAFLYSNRGAGAPKAGSASSMEIGRAPPKAPGGYLAHLGMMGDMLKFVTAAAKAPGAEAGVVRMQPLPLLPVYVVTSPALAHKILGADAEKYERSKPGQFILKQLFGPQSILTAEGEVHRRIRAELQKAFLRAPVREHAPTVIGLAEDAAARWKPGQVVDIAAEMHELTLHMFARSFFGIDPSGPVSERILHAMHGLVEIVARSLTGLPLPVWIPTKFNRDRARVKREVDAAIYGLIAERAARPNPAPTLLDHLIAAQPLTPERKEFIRDQLTALFFAGHETSANLLAWTFHLISRHPRVEEKLRAELAGAIGDRPVAPQDLDHLPYLKAVLRESIRMYPPGWLLDRAPVEDVVLDGIRVPKGTWLLLPLYHFSRSSAFNGPEDFLPERFMDEKSKNSAYIPFGEGPHFCLGSLFAMDSVQAAVAIVLKKWRLTGTDAPAPEIAPGASLGIKGGLKMVVEPAEPAVGTAPATVDPAPPAAPPSGGAPSAEVRSSPLKRPLFYVSLAAAIAGVIAGAMSPWGAAHPDSLRAAVIFGGVFYFGLWERFISIHGAKSKLAHYLKNIAVGPIANIPPHVAGALLWTALVGRLPWLQHVGLLPLMGIGGWSNVLLSFLFLDLAGYVAHVYYHRVPFFWRFHKVHHSDTELDASTGIRGHAGEIVIASVFDLLTYLLCGPSIVALFAYKTFEIVQVFILHMDIEANEKLGAWLAFFGLNTWREHHNHHSSTMKYTDSNYGGLFIWWDKLFKTYTAPLPMDQIQYGLGDKPEDLTTFRLLLMPLPRKYSYRIEKWLERASAPVKRLAQSTKLWWAARFKR